MTHVLLILCWVYAAGALGLTAGGIRCVRHWDRPGTTLTPQIIAGKVAMNALRQRTGLTDAGVCALIGLLWPIITVGVLFGVGRKG